MLQTNLAQESHGDGVDADALCSQCHTINADGALICKTCGNNLRDQRHERLGEEELLIGAEAGLKRRIAVRILGGFGFLLVILVAVNANHVADWMVRVGSSAPPDGRILWQGDDGATFDLLAAELDGFSVPRGVLRKVMSDTKMTLNYEGTYALINGRDALGYAVARKKGDVLYVVAKTTAGAEVRLKFHQEGVKLNLVENGAGALIGGQRSAPVGGVRQDPRGIMHIGGRDDLYGNVFTCTAYRLPES